MIDTTYTSSRCKNPIFSVRKLERFSSTESEPVIVLSWITAPGITKKKEKEKEFSNKIQTPI